MPIGDLRTVYNDQLVYKWSRHSSDSSHWGFKLWLVHNCQMEEDRLKLLQLCYCAGNKLQKYDVFTITQMRNIKFFVLSLEMDT